MFIRELFEIILQGLFLIVLAYIGHIKFSKNENKYPKIINILINILK